jgi:hypothetical protein
MTGDAAQVQTTSKSTKSPNTPKAVTATATPARPTTLPTAKPGKPPGTIAAASNGGPILMVASGGGFSFSPVRTHLSYIVYDTGRAIVGLYDSAAGVHWADVSLAPADLSQLKRLIDTLIPGGARLSTQRTDGTTFGVSDVGDISATAWYDGVPHAVSAVNVLGFIDTTKLIERARFDALSDLGKLVQSRASVAPDYAPDGLALVSFSVSDDITLPQWPSMALDTFGEPFNGPKARCGVVTGPDIAVVRTAVWTPQPHLWTSGSGAYNVEAQPLLPGQTSCHDAYP